MNLIIGGAYQGKLTYAAENYHLSPDETFDLAKIQTLPVSQDGFPENCRCFFHFEALTKKAAAQKKFSPEEFLKSLPEIFFDSVIVSREIGSGIVPTDGFERAYREFHGSVLSLLVRRSESVIRIFCGLPEVLK